MALRPPMMSETSKQKSSFAQVATVKKHECGGDLIAMVVGVDCWDALTGCDLCEPLKEAGKALMKPVKVRKETMKKLLCEHPTSWECAFAAGAAQHCSHLATKAEKFGLTLPMSSADMPPCD